VRRPPAIDQYEYEDFVLHDYIAQPHIKAPVAV
jgi:thymidylate synthase